MKATFTLTDRGLDFRLEAESLEEQRILPLLETYKFEACSIKYNRDYNYDGKAEFLRISFLKPIEPSGIV